MDIAMAECTSSAANHGQVIAELVGSGLVHRLVPLLALRDLQSLVNVSPVLRGWADLLSQPDWQAHITCLVPSSHYLANVVTGMSTATRGHTGSLHPLSDQLTAAGRPP